jgi:hypothetical protein
MQVLRRGSMIVHHPCKMLPVRWVVAFTSVRFPIATDHRHMWFKQGDVSMLVQPHLFIPGPTNIPEAVRRAMDIPMEDMRSPEFPKFTMPIFEDLKKVFKMKDGRVFIFPSSGQE